MAEITLSYSNPLKEQFTDEFFAKIPMDPGVYFFIDEDGRPLYIGKADRLKRRLQSYRAAKPGQMPERILEMIEMAKEIVWEIHPDGKQALVREGELIQSLRPPFNVAGNWDVTLLQFGFKRLSGRTRPGNQLVQFRLSHHLPANRYSKYDRFGCFLHRGKTKAGYSALLRLMHACAVEGRFHHFPEKLCRAWPMYNFRMQIPQTLLQPLTEFMSGESRDLLQVLTAMLLEKENIPPHLYAPLQRDLKTLEGFFETGPKTTRTLLRKAGVHRPFASQSEMRKLVMAKNKKNLKDLVGASALAELRV